MYRETCVFLLSLRDLDYIPGNSRAKQSLRPGPTAFSMGKSTVFTILYPIAFNLAVFLFVGDFPRRWVIKGERPTFRAWHKSHFRQGYQRWKKKPSLFKTQVLTAGLAKDLGR